MGCGASSPNPSDFYSTESSPTRTSTASESLLQDALYLVAVRNLSGDRLRLLKGFLGAHPDIPLNFALTEVQSKAILQMPYRAGDFRPGSTLLLNAAAYATTVDQIAVLQWLLSSPVGRAPINSWDTIGSPLTSACRSDDGVEVARMLIAAGARVNDGGRVGRTALHTAAMFGAAAVIALLLQSGADIDQASSNGQTAEDFADAIEDPIKRAATQAAFAAWRQQTGSARKARRAQLREAQQTVPLDPMLMLLADALAFAAAGNLATLQALFQAHPALPLDFTLTEDQSKAILKQPYRAGDFRPGSTMLINAAARGHVAVLQWLLSTPAGRAPISSWDTIGSPLTFACMNDHVEVARILIAAGARVNDGGPFGFTALHQAARVSAPAIIALLLESGADIDQPDINRRTAEDAADANPIERAAAIAAFAEWRWKHGSVRGKARRAYKPQQQLAHVKEVPLDVARDRDAVQHRFSTAADAKHSTGTIAEQQRSTYSGDALHAKSREALQHASSQASASRATTESGLAACKAVAFRLAKLALVGAHAVPGGAPLIDRAALESLLYETLSCHPVASYLAGEHGASGAGAGGHRQIALCDFLLPLLRPFLDEPAPSIREEMQRALSSFMHTHTESPSAAAAMQPQSQSSAMGSESMPPHDSPPAYEAATSSPAPAPTFAACPTATGDFSCFSSPPPAPTFAVMRATDDDDSWSPRKDR